MVEEFSKKKYKIIIQWIFVTLISNYNLFNREINFLTINPYLCITNVFHFFVLSINSNFLVYR